MITNASTDLLDNLGEALRNEANLPEEPCAALENYCKLLAASPELSALWIKACDAFTGPDCEAFFSGPLPKEFHVPEQGLFLLSVAAYALMKAPQNFKDKGIAERFLLDGMKDLRIWLENYQRNFHAWGLDFDNGFAWMVLRIFRAEVLRFGRLEYNKSSAFPEYLFFKNRKTGNVKIVFNAECACNPAGFPARQGEKISFRTHCVGGIFGTITGYQVRADGSISPETLTLDLSEYIPLLLPCEPSLYLHIPADGPLEEKACCDSLRNAMKFYKNRKDGFSPKAVICSSWLFDPVLKELLPPESNILKFWKSGYLLPQVGGESDAVQRVFGLHVTDKTAIAFPRKNRLQKSMAEYLENGGIFRGGRIVFFPE